MEKLAERLWQDMLDKNDRNSPEEYPEMILITFDEFKAALSEAASYRKEEAAPR